MAMIPTGLTIGKLIDGLNLILNDKTVEIDEEAVIMNAKIVDSNDSCHRELHWAIGTIALFVEYVDENNKQCCGTIRIEPERLSKYLS